MPVDYAAITDQLRPHRRRVAVPCVGAERDDSPLGEIVPACETLHALMAWWCEVTTWSARYAALLRIGLDAVETLDSKAKQGAVGILVGGRDLHRADMACWLSALAFNAAHCRPLNMVPWLAQLARGLDPDASEAEHVERWARLLSIEMRRLAFATATDAPFAWPTPAVVERTIDALARTVAALDLDEQSRLDALDGLRTIGEELPEHARLVGVHLASALTDGCAPLRRAAIGALCNAADVDSISVDAVVSALSDDDATVRRAAVSTLCRLGERAVAACPALLPALMALARDGTEAPAPLDVGLRRRDAVALLRELAERAPKLVPAVLDVLLFTADSEVWAVRRASAEALGALALVKPAIAWDVVEPLCRLARDRLASVVSRAVHALQIVVALDERAAAIAMPTLRTVAARFPSLREPAENALRSAGERVPKPAPHPREYRGDVRQRRHDGLGRDF